MGNVPWWVALIGLVMGGGGIGSAVVAARTTAKVEAAKTKAVANQNEIDANRQKLEGWDTLVAGLTADSERKDKLLVAKDARIEYLEGMIMDLTGTKAPSRTPRKKVDP